MTWGGGGVTWGGGRGYTPCRQLRPVSKTTPRPPEVRIFIISVQYLYLGKITIKEFSYNSSCRLSIKYIPLSPHLYYLVYVYNTCTEVKLYTRCTTHLAGFESVCTKNEMLL